MGARQIPGVPLATVLLIPGVQLEERVSLRNPAMTGGIYFCEIAELCEPTAHSSSEPVHGGEHAHATPRPETVAPPENLERIAFLIFPWGISFHKLSNVSDNLLAHLLLKCW